MSEKKKYFGIGQPIHYDTLNEVFLSYFSNKMLSREKIVELLKVYLHGENSINKAYNHVNRIITKNAILLEILKNKFTQNEFATLSPHENKCLIYCLVTLTFPVSYDLTNILARGFKAESKLNREYIDRKLTSIYGTNRSIYNAINALLPMYKEFDLIKKEKTLFVSCSQNEINNKIVNEFLIYTDIKLSGSKSILLDDLEYRSFYYFFKPSYKNFSQLDLIKTSESRIGQKYISI